MRKIRGVVAYLAEKQLHIHGAAHPDNQQHYGQNQRAAKGIYGVNRVLRMLFHSFFKYSFNRGGGVGQFAGALFCRRLALNVKALLR